MKKRKNSRFTSMITNKRVVKSNQRPIKQIVFERIINKFTLSIISGVIIGTIFGLTTLYIVNSSGEQVVINDTLTTRTENATVSSNEQTSLRLEVPDLYVVQVGLFHSFENAEMKQKQLERSDIRTFIWERQGEYFLLHRLYSNELAAQAQKESLLDRKIETYVKKWYIEVPDKQVKNEERIWIEQLITWWQHSLQQTEANASIDIATWKEIVEQEYESDFITKLQLKWNEDITELQQNENSSIVLLKILMQLEQLLNE